MVNASGNDDMVFATSADVAVVDYFNIPSPVSPLTTNVINITNLINFATSSVSQIAANASLRAGSISLGMLPLYVAGDIQAKSSLTLYSELSLGVNATISYDSLVLIGGYIVDDRAGGAHLLDTFQRKSIADDLTQPVDYTSYLRYVTASAGASFTLPEREGAQYPCIGLIKMGRLAILDVFAKAAPLATAPTAQSVIGTRRNIMYIDPAVRNKFTPFLRVEGASPTVGVPSLTVFLQDFSSIPRVIIPCIGCMFSGTYVAIMIPEGTVITDTMEIIIKGMWFTKE
jgi:hypothetical protein